MKRHRCLIAILVLVGAASAQAATDPPLAVTGLVSNPLHLTLAELGTFPVTHVSATQVSGHGPVPLDCSGASLAAILDKAGLNVGNKNNARLGHSVLVTADDGYAIAFSMGEIDPDYGSENVIVATQCNGKTLENPRLVVSSDKHAGRAVQGVVSIEVK
jgi:DMSO/TMAO reductase YedYZ molybdopterin-dependent catalytic subunit